MKLLQIIGQGLQALVRKHEMRSVFSSFRLKGIFLVKLRTISQETVNGNGDEL